MKRIGHLVLLLLLGVRIPAAEHLPLDQNSATTEFAPAAAEVKATLLLPNSAMIGESIMAQLVIENTGARPFEITLGGDYRGTGYPLRMKVRVQNSEHVDLPRVDERPRFGGMMSTKRVEPGAREAIEFPLDCYVEFPRAGTYLVTAGHDFGWIVDPSHPHPIAQASLTVAEPSPEQAGAYVDKLFEEAEASSEYEREWRLDKQLCVLRHPAYLPALVERARGGSKAAVNGVGHIATPEATAALLAMLDSSSPAITTTAVAQLLRRVPSRNDPAQAAVFGLWNSPYQIQPLLPGAWRESFSERLVASALKLLRSADVDEVDAAARILVVRGEPEHAPALLAALRRALDVYHEPRTGPGANTLDAPKPQQRLIEAVDALRGRGWRIAYGGDVAHLVAWFRQLADSSVSTAVDEAARESMVTWLENGPATLRIAALEALPVPLPDACEPILLRILNDPDWGVLRVACGVAAKSKRPAFARPAVQILEEADDTFLQNAAHEAALACGAGFGLWQAWAAVLAKSGRTHEALRALIEGTIDLPRSNGSSGNGPPSREQRFALRAAWQGFLAAHHDSLVAGRRVRLTDPEAIARLTGADFQPRGPAIELSFPDGSRWPPGADR